MSETFEQMLQRTSLDLPAAIATLWEENDRLRATLACWQEAFGLLTTLAPDLEIDIRDPLGMAQAIERHVLAERAALAAATQRAEIAETRLAAVPVDDICAIIAGNDVGDGGETKRRVLAWRDEWIKSEVQL